MLLTSILSLSLSLSKDAGERKNRWMRNSVVLERERKRGRRRRRTVWNDNDTMAVTNLNFNGDPRENSVTEERDKNSKWSLSHCSDSLSSWTWELEPRTTNKNHGKKKIFLEKCVAKGKKIDVLKEKLLRTFFLGMKIFDILYMDIFYGYSTPFPV